MYLHYLKSNVKMEPLIWRWYAWPHLIPPLTAACNIVERHLKIMHSYVQNPQIHMEAMKDPKLLGGPFIDLEGKYIDEIQSLIRQTETNCAKLIQINNDLKSFDQLLQSKAEGDSLEELYNSIPSSLKGLVELVYDLNNHPSIRIIEYLVYHKHYTSAPQEIALGPIDGDLRKFVLSTPRIYQDSEIYIPIPFSDKNIDLLSKMRYEPDDIKKIENIFGIPEEKKKLFQSFFTTEPPRLNSSRNYTGNDIRVRYFGHACVLVETSKVCILFDPVISYDIESNIPRFSFNDLPDVIDYVIITHNHQDHLIFEILLQLRYKTRNIVFARSQIGTLQDPSVKLILQNTGFSSLIELGEFESINFSGGKIMAIPFFGEHSDLNIQSKSSFLVSINNTKFLFAADSNNLDPNLYNNIYDIVGPADIIFLGMECDGAPLTWLYGPLLSKPIKRIHDRNRSLSGSDYNKAGQIIKKLECKEVYVYAMGQEPWLGHIMSLHYTSDSKQILESDKLLNYCRENGIKSERLYCTKEWYFQ